MTNLALLTCLASTLSMTGLIWFVHVVHYRLFDRVDVQAFRRYHADHARTTSYVVIPLMILELLASLVLLFRRPAGSEPWMVWLGLGCVLVTWGSTFLYSVPAHNLLAMGFDTKAHRSLVKTNEIRVLSWTLHSIILLWMTARALR